MRLHKLLVSSAHHLTLFKETIMCRCWIVSVVAALGLVATTASPAAELTYLGDEPYTRYEITLEEALPEGHALTLHLGRQAGEFRQAWAQVDRTGVVATKVDASSLEVRDDRLRGEVEVWTRFDGDSYAVNLKMEEGVAGDGGPWLKRTFLSVRVRDGRAVGGSMTNNKGGFTATFDAADLKIENDRLTGTITGTVTSGQRQGTYTFQIEAAVIGRQLIGEFTSSLDGEVVKSGDIAGGIRPRAD